MQAMVQKYGTTVIAAPTAAGFDRVAWIMPYAALVFGLGLVIVIVRAWRNRPLLAHPGAVPSISGGELDHFREQARKETEL
jgi:cytochrome c-type biogenesis protein CcmH/NrfF